MEERLRFVARLLDGEGMSDVCREFGISRKTGYKIFNRYKDDGLEALTDRSRRPVRYANQLPDQIERTIVATKKDKPHWGARKIRELLIRRLAGDVRIPSKSTVHAVLDRHGRGHATVTGFSAQRVVVHGLQRRVPAGRRPLLLPLTVTDQASRYLLACEALESTKEGPVIEAFIRLFRERGLPAAIRSDNGLPFASPNGLYNLSRLSVFWLRLGIAIERIRPGRPQQNGRHERMHLTLKKETTRPPGSNILQQQARFEAFVNEFNEERPHEALAMKAPAELYTPASRAYEGLPEVEYPFHDRDVLVTACGRICMHRKKINGQRLGITVLRPRRCRSVDHRCPMGHG
jgi:transposase InsO family protein